MKDRLLKRYYTTTEMAELCQVSPTTIFRAIINKSIKAATTPGGHYRISSDEVENFLKKNNISIDPNLPRFFRILIVEDNPIELRFFKRALEKEKTFEVQATTSGYKAGFLTQSMKPDLILLDIFLKDMDGREVARLIRSDAELKHTKIIAITAAREPNVIKEIVGVGFDSLLFKPIDPDELREKVLRLLR